MSTRVSPVERIRADIDDLFASERDLGDVLEEVARLGVRLLMQTVMEAEVTQFLGRERYAHGERARPGTPTGARGTRVPERERRPGGAARASRSGRRSAPSGQRYAGRGADRARQRDPGAGYDPCGNTAGRATRHLLSAPPTRSRRPAVAGGQATGPPTMDGPQTPRTTPVSAAIAANAA